MSAFSQLKKSDGTLVDFERAAEQPIKRPSRWSLTNWPVRWKVLAIVLVPLVVAATFGGLRIYSSATEASEMRLAADRVELLPTVENYMATLEAAMLARATGGDAQAALTAFDASRQRLQDQLSTVDIAPDVRDGVKTLVEGGQALMDKVTANSIGLRDVIQSYALLLLPAEDAI
ncbi:ATP-binding protein, partial [Mycolicibacterium elephantis]